MRKAIATLLLLALAACSDPKAANEGNFTNALDTYVSQGGRNWLCFTSVYFPHQVNVWDNSDEKAQLVEMVDAGIVRKQQKTVSVQQFFGPPLKQTQVVYDVTPAGRSHMNSNQEFSGSQFCFAHIRVGQIVKWTEPNNSMGGITVSDVTWVPAIASMDPWAQQLLTAKKLGFAQRLVDRTAATQRNQMMDLTNKGWEVAQ